MGKTSLHKKNQTTKSISASLFLLCQSGMQLFWNLYLGCICLILPLYFKDGYRGIGSQKFLFFRNVSIQFGYFFCILFMIYLVLWWVSGERKSFAWKKQFSLTDLFVGIYGIAVLFSYLFSDFKDTALWGTEGWYMGLFTQFILVAVYFGVSRFWTPNRYILCGALLVSGFSFVLGILNRFQWDPLQMTQNDPLYISTIGNINWLCAYLVTFLCFAVGLCGINDLKTWQRRGLWLYVTVAVMALFTQGSASGYVTAFAMTFVCFCIFSMEREKFDFFFSYLLAGCVAILLLSMVRLVFPNRMDMQDMVIDFLTTGFFPILVGMIGVIWVACYFGKRTGVKQKNTTAWEKHLAMIHKLSIIVMSGCLFILFGYACAVVLHTLSPKSTAFLPDRLFLMDGDWGSKRGATWLIGILCLREQNLMEKLVGVGPDCMYRFIYDGGHDKISQMAAQNFGDLTLTNAHCEMLTVAVNLGILGFVGYAGMMVSGIRSMLRKKGPAFACGLAILAYQINNIFSFQQIMGISLVMILLGVGESCIRKERLDLSLK